MALNPILRLLKTFKDALWNFFEDDAVTYAASVAFFTALSLSPLLVLLLSISSFIGAGAREKLVHQLVELLGPAAKTAIEMVLKNVTEQKLAATISTIVSIVMLLFSASGVFVQLQKSMNKIWNIPPKAGSEIKEWFRKRLLSLIMVSGVGLLLLVSVVISTVLNRVLRTGGTGWEVMDFGASLVIFVMVFALMFKALPDTTVAWRDVWLGAIITAILFVAGKWAVGKYLAYASVGSAYGAAGSLLVLLVWVYYTSLVVFYGAELTQVYSPSLGQREDQPSNKERPDTRDYE